MSEIRHPGVVEVYELGSSGDGSLYMTMECLSGQPALPAIRLLGPPGSPARELAVMGVVSDVSAAAAALHAAGWVHRDIKSSNVMVLSGGQSVLIDAGVACRTDRESQRGGFSGTYAYAPPEQILGRVVDGRADVYALGILSYRLLTGQRPLEADSAQQWVQRKLSGAPRIRAEQCPGLRPEVGWLVEQMLQPEPRHRPQMRAIQQSLSPSGQGLAAVSGAAQGTLAALACAQQPVSEETLQHATEHSEAQVLADLMALTAAGLARRGAGGWGLLSANVRETVARATRTAHRHTLERRLEQAHSHQHIGARPVLRARQRAAGCLRSFVEL